MEDSIELVLMAVIKKFKAVKISQNHLLGIQDISVSEVSYILDEAKAFIKLNKSISKKTDILIKEINEIIKENDIKGIVVGNPLNMDGSSGKSSRSANDFAKNLSKNITIPITLWDERLSSQGSFKLASKIDDNISSKIENLDKNAAAFILQGAIDYLSN